MGYYDHLRNNYSQLCADNDRREATNTNYILFNLTRTGLETTIYQTQSEYANHYTTDALISKEIWYLCVSM
jgi:hypothetical protein